MEHEELSWLACPGTQHSGGLGAGKLGFGTMPAWKCRCQPGVLGGLVFSKTPTSRRPGQSGPTPGAPTPAASSVQHEGRGTSTWRLPGPASSAEGRSHKPCQTGTHGEEGWEGQGQRVVLCRGRRCPCAPQLGRVWTRQDRVALPDLHKTQDTGKPTGTHLGPRRTQDKDTRFSSPRAHASETQGLGPQELTCSSPAKFTQNWQGLPALGTWQAPKRVPGQPRGRAGFAG